MQTQLTNAEQTFFTILLQAAVANEIKNATIDKLEILFPDMNTSEIGNLIISLEKKGYLSIRGGEQNNFQTSIFIVVSVKR